MQSPKDHNKDCKFDVKIAKSYRKEKRDKIEQNRSLAISNDLK